MTWEESKERAIKAAMSVAEELEEDLYPKVMPGGVWTFIKRHEDWCRDPNCTHKEK